ncbi:MAG: hypothetical protein H7834_14165 [Magnetococcus sp. YQC-9]
MAVLIEEGDSDAQEWAAKARELLTGSSVEAGMERMAAQIDDYEFELARETLGGIVEIHLPGFCF